MESKRDFKILIEWEPLEGQTFNPEFDGYTVGHYSTGNPELGWCLYSRGTGGCWNQRTKQIKAPAPGLQPERIDGRWYWVEAEIPEVKYLGSTRDGVRYRVPPPTQTMIEDAGAPSAFVQDKLADMIEPEPRTCGNCGREVRGLQYSPEIPVHVDTESRACETSKRVDTFAEYAHSKSIFPPNISIKEGDQPT